MGGVLKQATPEAAREVAREVLVFVLDDEEYGVDILKVREIRGYDSVTPIPNAPAHVKGMMNLRGAIVPIVDLRIRFGRAEPRYDALTVVIVLQVSDRTVGMVVDGVSDVVRLKAAEIKPAPQLGAMMGESFLQDVATQGERMVLLVDIDRLLAPRELDALATAPAR
jgi:purine-binding chemotaxis protein CheW